MALGAGALHPENHASADCTPNPIHLTSWDELARSPLRDGPTRNKFVRCLTLRLSGKFSPFCWPVRILDVWLILALMLASLKVLSLLQAPR